jgi:hypothetical protein
MQNPTTQEVRWGLARKKIFYAAQVTFVQVFAAVAINIRVTAEAGSVLIYISPALTASPAAGSPAPVIILMGPGSVMP